MCIVLVDLVIQKSKGVFGRFVFGWSSKKTNRRKEDDRYPFVIVRITKRLKRNRLSREISVCSCHNENKSTYNFWMFFVIVNMVK